MFTLLLNFLPSFEATVLLASAIPFVIWSLAGAVRLRKRLPPSPFQLPLLGCLPFLDRRFPHLSFSRWAKQLGNIYSCRMGRQLVIVLNDAKLIREAFSQQCFNGRPDMYTSRVTSQGNGISFATDNTWQIHRKFALKTFKMLGVGKNVMEEKIHEEAQRLINAIALQKGRPFCNKNMLRVTMSNVICAVIFGKSFQTDSNEVHGFYDQMNSIIRYFGVAGILNIFPGLIVVPAIRKSFEKVIDALNQAAGYITEMFDQHMRTFNSCVIRDFTDAFIESRLKEKVNLGAPELFTDKQYVAAARELFLTGYESTSATTRWALLYTLADPLVQKKVQAELDQVVGRSRLPSYSDAKNMPYTQAVLCEVQRIACVGPMGLPHRATEETELAGYLIPKDAWIFTNLWHVHRNEDVWKNADCFVPERFLSDDRLSLEVPKQYMPFSAGKRQCPGESLAKMQLFIVYTTILQNFSLSLVGEPNFEPVNGITLDTKDYEMTAVAR